jgi:hypothetical protein
MRDITERKEARKKNIKVRKVNADHLTEAPML